MADWATALSAELNSREDGLAEAAGLTPGMSGVSFEETLGALLRWQDMRALNARFRALGGPRPGSFLQDVVRAAEFEEERIAQLMDSVNNTLFTLFGAKAIDERAAIETYSQLLALFPSLGLSVVTTNYDPAAEIALSGLGFSPDTGFRRVPGRAPVLDPDGLVQRAAGQDSATPVIHLHGAVGWYEHDGAVHEHYHDQPFDAKLGRPVVLYPDPEKDPTRDAVVQTLWREFDSALEISTHVLVIGHSLHDGALINKLRQAVNSCHVAISIYGGPGGPTAGGSSQETIHDEVERMSKLVPGPVSFPAIDFAPAPNSVLDDIALWVAQTTD